MPPSTPTTVQWCIMEMRFPIDFACQQGTGGGQMDCVLMVVVLPQIMHIIVFSSWVTLSSSIYVEYSPVSCSTCTLILCISSSSAINRANSLMSLRSKSSQENNTATCAATNYIKSLITCLNTIHFSIFVCAFNNNAFNEPLSVLWHNKIHCGGPTHPLFCFLLSFAKNVLFASFAH